MFARPTPQKKPPKTQNVGKKIIFSSTNTKNKVCCEKGINKIASIRTLPPFSALINSSSGANSQRKSFQCSQSNSELQIWKDEDELFTTSSTKEAMKTIDEQLREVLETIRKERNLIDLKICKLRAKMEETRSRSDSRLQKIISDRRQIGTSTEGEEEVKKCMVDKEVQEGWGVMGSNYLKRLGKNLGLLGEYQGGVQQEELQVDDETKICENKVILEMLFQKMANI